VADVQDHHRISLDRIINTIRVPGRRQDADFRIVGKDADQWPGEQSRDACAQMLANAIRPAGEARSAM